MRMCIVSCYVFMALELGSDPVGRELLMNDFWSQHSSPSRDIHGSGFIILLCTILEKYLENKEMLFT